MMRKAAVWSRLPCLKQPSVSMDYTAAPFFVRKPGGFNRSLQHRPKSIDRRFKPQGFPGALVQSQRDLVQVRLRVTGEIGSFWEVLTQKAVGVFIAAALPRAARIAEVDLHIGGDREVLVVGHLLAPIPSQ